MKITNKTLDYIRLPYKPNIVYVEMTTLDDNAINISYAHYQNGLINIGRGISVNNSGAVTFKNGTISIIDDRIAVSPSTSGFSTIKVYYG